MEEIVKFREPKLEKLRKEIVESGAADEIKKDW